LYKVGKMWLYVSQGTGTWAVPMRLGSRDEIAVFNLTPHNQ
jgi:predicted MPP superfamily phosphohydrolase